MKINLVYQGRFWCVVNILLAITVSANSVETKERVKTGLLQSCMGLTSAQNEICNQIEVDDDFVENDVYCNIEDCRESCCMNVRDCFKTNFFSNNRIECVSSKLKEDYGSCCSITERKYNKTKVLYISGALGVAVATTGIFLLSFMRSRSDEEYDSSDFEDEDLISSVENGSPHLDVKQMVATDGNDVFWGD